MAVPHLVEVSSGFATLRCLVLLVWSLSSAEILLWTSLVHRQPRHRLDSYHDGFCSGPTGRHDGCGALVQAGLAVPSLALALQVGQLQRPRPIGWHAFAAELSLSLAHHRRSRCNSPAVHPHFRELRSFALVHLLCGHVLPLCDAHGGAVRHVPLPSQVRHRRVLPAYGAHLEQPHQLQGLPGFGLLGGRDHHLRHHPFSLQGAGGGAFPRHPAASVVCGGDDHGLQEQYPSAAPLLR
mmetsp:Transcript_95125/g.226443  ORF Transcript_95125/g.226443 Transcript_95125/m.226443 type:complete len:238 (-) Transcript_95125:940-1653(-)